MTLTHPTGRPLTAEEEAHVDEITERLRKAELIKAEAQQEVDNVPRHDNQMAHT